MAARPFMRRSRIHTACVYIEDFDSMGLAFARTSALCVKWDFARSIARGDRMTYIYRPNALRGRAASFVLWRRLGCEFRGHAALYGFYTRCF